jgi:hypothetical protein
VVSYQLHAIDISDVDRQNERLSITVTCDDETSAFRFALEDDEAGMPRLRLDVEHSEEVGLDWIQSLLEVMRGSSSFDGLAVFYNLEHNECQECDDGCDACAPDPNRDRSVLELATPFSFIIQPDDYKDGAKFSFANQDDSDTPTSIENYAVTT